MVQTLQIKALIDYIELHPELAMGRMARTKEGRILAKRLWADCATMLSAVCADGPHKTANEWRLFFNEYKSKMYRKMKALKKAREGPDGKFKSIYLTPLQERLCGILGWDFKDPLMAMCHNELTVKDETIQLEDEQMPSPVPSCEGSPDSPSSPGSSISSYCARAKKRQLHMSDNITNEQHSMSDHATNSQHSMSDNIPIKRHHSMSDNIAIQFQSMNNNDTNRQHSMSDNIPIKRKHSMSDNIAIQHYSMNDNVTNRQHSMSDSIPSKWLHSMNENNTNQHQSMSDNSHHNMSIIKPTNTTNQHDISVPQLDRFDYMAKTWAETLRILPNEQRIIAEKIINEVFFEAQLDTLTRESHLKVKKQSNDNIRTTFKIE